MATTKRIRLAIAAGIVGGTLIACGGGGDTAPPPSGGGTTVALSGTAAKGLMANADVTALPVNADGTIGSTALATSSTDASGHYTLSATKDQPHVIQVKARADGTTTHLDEVTGATDVSAALGTAVGSVLGNVALKGGVSSTTLAASRPTSPARATAPPRRSPRWR